MYMPKNSGRCRPGATWTRCDSSAPLSLSMRAASGMAGVAARSFFCFLVGGQTPTRGGCGGAIFFVLFGGRPIHQRGREFLPIFALGAVVAYALTLDFIFRNGLVGTVFEDEAVGGLLSRGMKRE